MAHPPLKGTNLSPISLRNIRSINHIIQASVSCLISRTLKSETSRYTSLKPIDTTHGSTRLTSPTPPPRLPPLTSNKPLTIPEDALPCRGQRPRDRQADRPKSLKQDPRRRCRKALCRLPRSQAMDLYWTTGSGCASQRLGREYLLDQAGRHLGTSRICIGRSQTWLACRGLRNEAVDADMSSPNNTASEPRRNMGPRDLRLLCLQPRPRLFPLLRAGGLFSWTVLCRRQRGEEIQAEDGRAGEERPQKH